MEKINNAKEEKLIDLEIAKLECVDDVHKKTNKSLTYNCRQVTRNKMLQKLDAVKKCSPHNDFTNCGKEMKATKKDLILESFKASCGAEDLVRTVDEHINLGLTLGVKPSAYQGLNQTDSAFSCGTKNIYVDNQITTICGELADSSGCWASLGGREWCHVRKNVKEWDRRYVQEDDYIFATCCGGGRFEERPVHEVNPR